MNPEDHESPSDDEVSSALAMSLSDYAEVYLILQTMCLEVLKLRAELSDPRFTYRGERIARFSLLFQESEKKAAEKELVELRTEIDQLKTTLAKERGVL